MNDLIILITASSAFWFISCYAILWLIRQPIQGRGQ